MSDLQLRSRRDRALGYAALALLAYVPPLLTAPGKVAADTKQYLYLDPGRLMSRAASMWDPNVGMGTVTHQTIGYLFPMGPYYWILDRLGVPDWVAQRLWLGTLLFAAAVGMLYLLRTFALRGPGIVVAALAYMLTPYVLDYAARISVLLLPWAALPWMIGVTRKALRDPPPGRLSQWRYPAIFALIVQVIGGVNATALLFALLGPALWVVYAWLIARDVTFRRVLAVTLRTGLLTLLASLWWISGLRMQAAYGLDILRYTETVDAVARTSTPNEVLRGLGYWFFYGQDRLGPWIESAPNYTQHLWVIISGYTLAALALLAAAFLRWRHRAYFVALLLLGVVIAVGAHPYAHSTPLGALFKAFASNSTAGLAMRSTGRAAPLVVLALALFLGLGTNVVSERLRARGRVTLALAAPLVVVGLLLVNFPAVYDGSLYGKNLQRPEDVPSYWTQAIAAASARGNATRILEVPGSDFASYTWGNTVDPITPGLTDRPYVARELIPYGTAGSADLLNAMDRRLQEGVADPAGLAALWRRMGIGDVIARNDIQWQRYDLVPPRELARVLARVPGLGTAKSYGPPSQFATPGYQDEITLAAPANEPGIAPVVVHPVTDAQPIVRAESPDHALMVSGDGEGLVDAADIGLLDGAGIVRYSASFPNAKELRDATGAGTVLVVTDNNRLRARRWTSVKDNLGYTEQAGEVDKPLANDNGDARLPLFPTAAADTQTTTVDVGAQQVTASAYGNTITYTPEDRAARAFDGDTATAWRGNAFGDARGQRLRLDLDAPISTDHVNLVQPLTGGRNRTITEVELRFDDGDPLKVELGPASRTARGQTVPFRRQRFKRFDLKILRTSDQRTNLFGRGDSVGFAEIRLRDEQSDADVHIREVEQMPTDLMTALGAGAGTHPLVLVMRRDAVRPVPPRSQPEQSIERAFTLPAARTFVLTGNAAVSPDAAPGAIQAVYAIPDAAHGGVTMRASATLPGCLACGPQSAIDGDALTAWQTPFNDVRNQYVEYRTAAPLSFDHLDLRVLADGRHSVPTRLRLEVDGQKRDLPLPAITDQAPENASTLVHLEFPRVTGRAVRATITGVREERSLRFASDATPLLPAGIAELGVPGLHVPAPTGAAGGALDSRCRSDLVAIDGRPVPVRVTGPASGADAVMALAVTPCDPADALRTPTIELGPGRHVLTTARGVDAGWSVDRLVLASGVPGAPVNVADGRITAIGAPAPVPPRVEVVRNGATSMRVHVTGATRPFWMVLGESQSPGWRASVVGGRSLGGSQLVDGYANGWLVNPERQAFDITLQWTPQRQVWAALWISLVAALGSLVIVALTWKRRAAFAVTATGDAEMSAGTSEPVTDSTRRVRWLAPLLAGLLAAIAVSPVVGLVVAALIAVVAWQPSLRRAVMVLPAVLLFGCGLYIAIQQYRYRYPPVFEWPTLFGRVRTAAWIAVMLLAGDVILELLRSRRAPTRKNRGDSAATAEGAERSVEPTNKNGAHGDDPDR